MCGVIGLVCERSRPDLGRVAGELLKTLEYRGYDSTGAAIQGDSLQVDLRKGVGAPSLLVDKLGISGLGGRVLCGQVRWATFGAVDEANSQPHVVRCHGYLYGAHNGNVTNCDELKHWLLEQGHQVQSDNDGEMVVHVVEHYFAAYLAQLSGENESARSAAMRLAVGESVARLRGSFAAVIVDPVTRHLYGIKNGSSFYAGMGRDPEHGAFAIASSDLSAVLKLTDTLIPLTEGEFVELTPAGYTVLGLEERGAPTPRERALKKTRLRAQDTSLAPGFDYFMQQEIAAQQSTCGDVVRLFDGQPSAGLDADDVAAFQRAVAEFVLRCVDARTKGGRVFFVCCGTSYHAAKAAALFFAELAEFEILPLLPGEFRGQYARELSDGDLFVAVSQSGETKDLVDIVNDILASGRRVYRVAVVNNVNSTLAQEKADLVLPLHCGPEIAVPATKSFISQLTVLYGLAARVGERTVAEGASLERPRLAELPALVGRALAESRDSIAAASELLYLAPSIHLLATRLVAVAKEGSLKIREVVLNHTEGFEGSEFKHGPNTILGFNTVFGPKSIAALLDQLAGPAVAVAQLTLPPQERAQMMDALVRGIFDPSALDALPTDQRKQLDSLRAREACLAALKSDYPLVFITGPDPRDVALTVSQINTHKIRGATTVVVAEENADLRRAAEKLPAGQPGYRSAYIPLPATGSTLLTTFSATIAIQRLAFEMSVRKKAYLDRLGIADHGVHPDVPKNVSKSITVD